MPQTTLAGHPVHPQLVAFPIGLLPFSFVLDVMHTVTRKESYAEAAFYTMVGGCVGGLAAGATGAADYLTIPPDSHSKKTANLHALLNLAVMGLYGINLFLRRGRKPPTGFLPKLLSLAGTAGLIISSWYGGELVYELGMRVKPLMEGEQGPEWKLPHDRELEQGFRNFEERYAPSGGPQD